MRVIIEQDDFDVFAKNNDRPQKWFDVSNSLHVWDFKTLMELRDNL